MSELPRWDYICLSMEYPASGVTWIEQNLQMGLLFIFKGFFGLASNPNLRIYQQEICSEKQRRIKIKTDN